jgi:hypothetical protein
VLRALFQKKDGRVATARLTYGDAPVMADLLFQTSGIERLVVRSAVPLEIMPGVTAPVILRPHLIAMKLVAGRDQDLGDIGVLLDAGSPEELAVVDAALQEVPAEKRGPALELWQFIKNRRALRQVDFEPKSLPKAKKPRK